MTVRGGVSFGASASVSGKGLISFGSETTASNLHQEIWAIVSEETRLGP